MNSAPWALVIPLANEENDFQPFISAIITQLNNLPEGKVFLVVDNVSKDRTLELCKELSHNDSRFVTVWAPENKNVVDAYLRGYREALKGNSEYIIEMDAGMSHDPAVIPLFLEKLSQGYACVFGSRFIAGGSMGNSPFKRKFLSSFGTFLSNTLLGTKLKDMTSGFQGFHRDIVKLFVNYPLLSRGHFYQTELKYLLRKNKSVEIPIQYNAPSPRVSQKSIQNSLSSLKYYFLKRISGKPVSIK